MVAKIPFRISSLMMSAWLTPRASARSLTAIEVGSSMAVVGSDVDPPARELRREARVLPLLADGEAELALWDDDVRDLVLLVDPDADHLGRAERLGDVTRRVLVPQDDVDLLAI